MKTPDPRETYDPKCWYTAVHFLEGMPISDEELSQHARNLADQIQKLVDEYVLDIEQHAKWREDHIHGR